MDQNNLVIAMKVPYEVEISATGIPLHESQVEFCVHRNDIRFSFPAKMVDDKKFMFTITEDIKSLANQTLEYRLYVYYGNARFEADTGTFNLIDKDAFDVKMSESNAPSKNPVSDSLNERLKDLAKRSKAATKKKEAPVVETTEENVEPTATASKPTPTPTVTPTATVAQVKEALRETLTKDDKPVLPSIAPPTTEAETAVVETTAIDPNDPNVRVREILASINKTVTPSVSLSPTPTVEETQTSGAGGKFFSEVDNMRSINAKRRKNKQIRDAIKKSTKKKDD